MPRIKIKQLDERIATSGLHFGGPLERRKLYPGEIVEFPEGPELDALYATGKIEFTMEPATRPLDFANTREAQLTAPTYKSRGPDEDREIAQARANVSARIAEQSDAQPLAESPADDTQPKRAESSPADTEPKPSSARNRRAARRAAAKGASRGQEATA